MIIYFEYFENIGFKNIEEINITSPSLGYRAFQNNGFVSCYIDTNKYDADNCHIYYIRDFMKKYGYKLKKKRRTRKKIRKNT